MKDEENNDTDIDINLVTAALLVLQNYVASAASSSTSGAIGAAAGMTMSGSAASTQTSIQDKSDVNTPEVIDSMAAEKVTQVSSVQASLNVVAIQAANTTQRYADAQSANMLFYSNVLMRNAVANGQPIPMPVAMEPVEPTAEK